MAERISADAAHLQTDVVILGTGGAGLRAAIAARRAGAEVLVVSKMGREDLNCTIRAWGGFTYAPETQVDELFRQVVETGGFLGNQRLVEILARETPKRMAELAELGVDMKLWGENPSPQDLGILKLTATGVTAGFGLTRPLRAYAERIGVQFLDNVMVSSVVVSDGRVHGVLGLHLSRGNLMAIAAKAVVIAAGGGAYLYERTDNPPGTTADGMALGYDAGVELVDIECVSFQFPSKRLEELFAAKEIPDEKLLSVGAAHFFLGGIRIDERCRTSVAGLYAAGETAGGVFGAARLGGSALADIIVFGTIAGQEAASYASGALLREMDSARIEQERKRLNAMLSDAGGTPARDAASRLRAIMWRHCGTMKTRKNIQKGLEKIAELEAQKTQLRVSTISELREAIECLNMITVAKLIATASLLREETRGCFWRIDFPKPDNTNWIKSIYLRQVNGQLRHEIRPAVMTRLTSPTKPRIGAGCFSYLP